MATEKRLIDANALEAQFCNTKLIEIFPYWRNLPFSTQFEVIMFAKAFKQMMQNAPTVDAAEVVHGRWIPTNCECDGICSVCNTEFDNYTNDVFEDWNYCPNCGAKMDGGKDNG